jgi:hypothetical protein
MAAALLGPEGLTEVLDKGFRVVISNRAPQRSSVTVLSAAVALHDETGAIRLQTEYMLNLRPGQAKILDALPATTAVVIASEVVMRLYAGEEQGFVEAYAMIEGTAEEPLGTIEFGIVETADLEEPGATAITEAPDFAVFARSER